MVTRYNFVSIFFFQSEINLIMVDQAETKKNQEKLKFLTKQSRV